MENVRRKAAPLRMMNALASGAIRCLGLPKIEAPPGCIAMDTHIHSAFSKCSTSPVERIILRAAAVGLSAIAITDHNDIQSARYAADCADDLKRRKLIPEDFLIIPGMEISFGGGHIGALFLNEQIPARLGVQETVKRIHDAGGLAVAVHPCLRSGVRDAFFDAPFDALEVESGSVLTITTAERGYKMFADERLENMARLGSSDAHYVPAVGMCYTLVEVADVSLDSIRAALMNGRSSAHPSPTCLRFRRLFNRIPLAR